jgi:hypothetical protein
MAILFGRFGGQKFFDGKKLVSDIYGNPNSPKADKLFISNLYKIYNLYILMEFYKVPSRRVYPTSSRWMKCPLTAVLTPKERRLRLYHSKGKFALTAGKSLPAVRSLVAKTWLNLVLRISY